MADESLLQWLVSGAIVPSAVAWPVEWALEAVAGAARRWGAVAGRKDDLSRLIQGAVGDEFDLDDEEFRRVRELLCDANTWHLIGRGTDADTGPDATVEALTVRVAHCLPPREDRSKELQVAAASAIARGLLEFVVWDLDPKLFQRVLMARLDRLVTNQASQFEKRLGDLHADLYSDTAELLAMGVKQLGQSVWGVGLEFRRLWEWQEKLQRQQYRSVVERLKSLAERLPPRPAGRGDVRVYLERLAAWLDEDDWLRHEKLVSGLAAGPADAFSLGN